MCLYSELLNKKVVSLYECQTLGTICGIYVDNKTKCSYIEIDDGTLRRIIKPDCILSYKNDFVIIKNINCVYLKDCLELSIYKQSKIVGIDIIDHNGKSFGKIQDIKFNDNFIIESIYSSNKEIIDSTNILKVTIDICMIKGDNFTGSINKYKPKAIPKPKKVKRDTKVSILEVINEPKTTINKNQQITNKGSNFNFSMLIGRRMKKNIVCSNGEILLKANSTIAKEDLKKIRIFGKLYEVLKYSE